MSLQEKNGQAILAEAGIDIATFIDRLDKATYNPQRGDCVSFAVALCELFDGDALLSCWVPSQVRGPAGTLHTTALIDGTPYDSYGIADVDRLVSMGFDDLIEYSSRPGLEWVNEASHEEVRDHAREYLIKEQAPETVKRRAANYDDTAYEAVQTDFERTLENL